MSLFSPCTLCLWMICGVKARRIPRFSRMYATSAAFWVWQKRQYTNRSGCVDVAAFAMADVAGSAVAGSAGRASAGRGSAVAGSAVLIVAAAAFFP